MLLWLTASGAAVLLAAVFGVYLHPRPPAPPVQLSVRTTEIRLCGEATVTLRAPNDAPPDAVTVVLDVGSGKGVVEVECARIGSLQIKARHNGWVRKVLFRGLPSPCSLRLRCASPLNLRLHLFYPLETPSATSPETGSR